jgi:hypothetical protein
MCIRFSHTPRAQVAFTDSTLVGRKIMAAAAQSNLKNVTLELGGKRCVYVSRVFVVFVVRDFFWCFVGLPYNTLAVSLCSGLAF